MRNLIKCALIGLSLAFGLAGQALAYTGQIGVTDTGDRYMEFLVNSAGENPWNLCMRFEQCKLALPEHTGKDRPNNWGTYMAEANRLNPGIVWTRMRKGAVIKLPLPRGTIIALNELDGQIAGLQATIADLRSQIAALEEHRAANLETISGLQKQIVTLRAKVDDLTSKNAALVGEKTTLTGDNRAQANSIFYLEVLGALIAAASLCLLVITVIMWRRSRTPTPNVNFGTRAATSP